MIVKKSLSEQIYENLRQDILDQKIKFGEKLVNRDLQERFAVSSTPIRDAVNRLYQDGLLEDISNVGARVISLTTEFAVKVNEIILILNIGAVGLANSKADPQELLSALSRCVEQQVLHIDDNEYFDYDRSFHMTFFDFCHNDRLGQIYTQHQTLWDVLVRTFYQDKRSTKQHAIEQHRQIINAISRQDIVQAQQYLTEHYRHADLTFDRLSGS